MKAGEVMTKHVEVISPDASVREAADRMRNLDTGVLPVCDGRELVGVITDRDITVRTTADGKDPESTKVREAMTSEAAFCMEDEDVEKAVRRMEEHRIRRMPVLSHDGKLAGMISLADLATRGDRESACEVLEKISEPTPKSAE